MFNQVFANTALSTAFLLLGAAMSIVCAVMALGIFMSRGKGQLSEDDEEKEYAETVRKITRRK